ncbi:hypothetical protein BU679_02765 [Staphylococcus chromogenes]|uniref:flavin reductase family protein n=1 Tax=Staphylococcus chromogenes TaxID=46126 RepID=UPI000D19BC18|nr:flavin reductase family protein [Staphylococcus chromogenes]MCE4966370.1 flavin reductase family protein [Staphylococcus chromogenes]PTF76249.1 hypothetical protein BUX97_03665 [Staphylococcus chromogenes]PTG52673.1 hypothetical protein BU679_02765 [Staphylococcus chromogenes]RIM07959.1 flavin reductase family protein [Staphylococcus chromogenes]
MFQFDATSLSKQQLYKFLIGTVVPRPIALVTTLSRTHTVNIAPFSFFNIVSSKPAILSIAVQRHDNGTMKDTAQNILDTKEAVIHIVTENNVNDANLTAAPLDKDKSELDLTHFTTQQTETSQVPFIQESPVRFETERYDHIEIKTDGQTVSDLILLEITQLYIDETYFDKEKGHVDVAGLKPVSRLAGDDYATLGELFTLNRPR